MKDTIKEILNAIILLAIIIFGLAMIIIPVFIISISIKNDFIAIIAMFVWAVFFCLVVKRFYK